MFPEPEECMSIRVCNTIKTVSLDLKLQLDSVWQESILLNYYFRETKSLRCLKSTKSD